jgi:hypothetical protein
MRTPHKSQRHTSPYHKKKPGLIPGKRITGRGRVLAAVFPSRQNQRKDKNTLSR